MSFNTNTILIIINDNQYNYILTLYTSMQSSYYVNYRYLLRNTAPAT